MSGEGQIFQFPAGLCSRLQDNGEICDLQWQKSFVVKAIENERDIVPVYFEARNSKKFYRIAKWRKKLGFKFNVEQILLPSEVIKARGSDFKIIFGTPISYQELKNSGKSSKGMAEEIKKITYSLKPQA